MRAQSALVVHPDASFRIAVGRLTRQGEHAIFFARDAAEARELLDGRPSLRVVAVAPEAGGDALAAELCVDRPGLSVLVLSDDEAAAPARCGFVRRLEEALLELDVERERRVGEVLARCWRLRASRAAERLAAERLSRLAPVPVAAGGEVRP